MLLHPVGASLAFLIKKLAIFALMTNSPRCSKFLRKLKIKNYITLLGLALVLYLLLIPSVYWLQRLLIFQPVKLSNTYTYEFEESFEEIDLQTPDGFTINNLYFCSQKDSTKGVILYFHGNADNMIRWSQYREVFTARGYDVMMTDYRGFGKSGGKPVEDALYGDAQLVYDWLSKQLPTEKIFLYGRSLGCAIAAQLATQVDTPLLILETPFDDIISVIQARLPILYLPYELDYRFSNMDHLAKVTCPVFILKAENDEIVPGRCTDNLKSVLKSKDRFIQIEGASHKNMAEFSEYELQLDRILGKRY